MRGSEPFAAEAGVSRPNRFATWLAILALAFQCFVVQTHVHAVTYSPAEASSSAQTHWAGATAHAPHEDAACLLCEQMALAGTVLMPTTHEIVLVEKYFFAKVTLPFIAAAWRVASHHWRSRAPPSSL